MSLKEKESHMNYLFLKCLQVTEDDITEISEVMEVTEATDISEASDQDNNKKVISSFPFLAL